MNCVFKRRGTSGSEQNGYAVTLAGAFDNSANKYVEINGTRYTYAQTITASEGAAVTVYLYADYNLCHITFNGTRVKGGSGSYTFTLTGDTQITMTSEYDLDDSAMHQVAEITTT